MVTFVASTSKSNASGSGIGNITINKPAGTETGHVMIAFVYKPDNAQQELTVPSGWTAIDTWRETSTLHAEMFYRVVTGADPSSYTWGSDITIGGWGVAILTFSGVDTANPIAASASSSSYTTGNPTTAPQITTPVAGCHVVTAKAILSNNSQGDMTTVTGNASAGVARENHNWGAANASGVWRKASVWDRFLTGTDPLPAGTYALTIGTSSSVTKSIMFAAALRPPAASTGTVSGSFPRFNSSITARTTIGASLDGGDFPFPHADIEANVPIDADGDIDAEFSGLNAIVSAEAEVEGDLAFDDVDGLLPSTSFPTVQSLETPFDITAPAFESDVDVDVNINAVFENSTATLPQVLITGGKVSFGPLAAAFPFPFFESNTVTRPFGPRVEAVAPEDRRYRVTG